MGKICKHLRSPHEDMKHTIFHIQTFNMSMDLKQLVSDVLYVMCLLGSVLIAFLWIDEHDWIKVAVTVSIQFKSFELFISRRPIKHKISRIFMWLSTIIYAALSYTVLAVPVPPTPIDQESLLNFSLSDVGNCTLTQGTDYCFNGAKAWYSQNFMNANHFQILADGSSSILSSIYSEEIFGVSEEEWEECITASLNVICGSHLPLCDHSCQPILLCSDLCWYAYDICPPIIGEYINTYGPILRTLNMNAGATEEEAQLFYEALSSIVQGCTGSLYASENNTVCFSHDMYEDHLQESTVQGPCTPDNAETYWRYQNNLNTTVDDELFSNYLDQLNKKNAFRLYLNMSFIFLALMIQFISYIPSSCREKYWRDEYSVEIDFLPFFCRFRIFLMAAIGGIICLMLRSIVLHIQLGVFYLVPTLITCLASGYIATRSLLLQDRRASHTESKTKSKAKKKEFNDSKNLLWRFYWKNFGRNGRFEYPKLVIVEFVEVSLQISVMLTLAMTDTTRILIAFVSIMSVNLIATPILILHPRREVWSYLNRMLDSLLDSLYLVLLYVSLRFRDEESVDATSDIIRGIIVPAVRLIVRIHFFSWSIVSESTRRKLKTMPHYDKSRISSIAASSFSPRSIDRRIRMFFAMCFATSGVILWFSTIMRIQLKNPECEEISSKEIWNSIDDHSMFPNGFMSALSCNFVSVTGLSMASIGLTQLSSNISILSNLEELDLSHNLLTDLPLELMELKYLNVLNVTGNPVEHIIDWSGKEIAEYPRQLFTLIGTLKSVDLSNNLLRSISKEDASALLHLELLNLSRNLLTYIDNSLWKQQTLTRLDVSYNRIIELSPAWPNRKGAFIATVTGNPVTKIDWSKTEEFPRIVDLPEELDELTNVTHFKAVNQEVFVFGGLSRISTLIHVNLSFNHVELRIGICEFGHLEILDFSYNHGVDPVNVWPSCDDGDKVSVDTLNVSGISSELFGRNDTSIWAWNSLKHVIANDMSVRNYTKISSSLSNLTSLRTLSFRNSAITGMEQFILPENLTLVDLRNTSISVSEAEQVLTDFNCSESIELLCKRVFVD